MKKLLIGVLVCLSLVGCGKVDVKEVREQVQNQELTKTEKREVLNEYIEDKQKTNASMVEKYLDGEIDKKEFDSYFMEQHNTVRMYIDNLEWEDYTSDETVWYGLYATYCKGITNRDGEPKENYDYSVEHLEIYFEIAQIADNEKLMEEYYSTPTSER